MVKWLSRIADTDVFPVRVWVSLQNCDGTGWFRYHADTVGTQVLSGFDSHRHNKGPLAQWSVQIAHNDEVSSSSLEGATSIL